MCAPRPTGKMIHTELSLKISEDVMIFLWSGLKIKICLCTRERVCVLHVKRSACLPVRSFLSTAEQRFVCGYGRSQVCCFACYRTNKGGISDISRALDEHFHFHFILGSILRGNHADRTNERTKRCQYPNIPLCYNII